MLSGVATCLPCLRLLAPMVTLQSSGFKRGSACSPRSLVFLAHMLYHGDDCQRLLQKQLDLDQLEPSRLAFYVWLLICLHKRASAAYPLLPERHCALQDSTATLCGCKCQQTAMPKGIGRTLDAWPERRHSTNELEPSIKRQPLLGLGGAAKVPAPPQLRCSDPGTVHAADARGYQQRNGLCAVTARAAESPELPDGLWSKELR